MKHFFASNCDRTGTSQHRTDKRSGRTGRRRCTGSPRSRRCPPGRRSTPPGFRLPSLRSRHPTTAAASRSSDPATRASHFGRKRLPPALHLYDVVGLAGAHGLDADGAARAEAGGRAGLARVGEAAEPAAAPTQSVARHPQRRHAAPVQPTPVAAVQASQAQVGALAVAVHQALPVAPETATVEAVGAVAVQAVSC